MASRIVFVATTRTNIMYDSVQLDFVWNKGLSFQQKQKNVLALHSEAHRKGMFDLLEVSTKSTTQLGKLLSAFNLGLKCEGVSCCVESAYQGSKVFERGGPYTDIYNMKGYEAKRDPRIRNSGDLIGFQFEGVSWGLDPGTSFYDWLYMNALYQNSELTYQVLKYGGFTDIEFNPSKSISCQARSCAIFVSLFRRGILDKAMTGKNEFLLVLSQTYGANYLTMQSDIDTYHRQTAVNRTITDDYISNCEDRTKGMVLSLLSERKLTARQIVDVLGIDWSAQKMAKYLSRIVEVYIVAHKGRSKLYSCNQYRETQTEIII